MAVAGTLTLALQHASVVRTFSVRPPAISRITFNQVNEPKVTVVIKSRTPPHAGAANYLHGGLGHGAGGEVRVFSITYTAVGIFEPKMFLHTSFCSFSTAVSSTSSYTL